MKWATASLIILVAVGLGLRAATFGVGIGYEVSGLVLLGALTETPINPLIDIRAQIGFATPGIAGLMLVTMDLLAHWPFPPFDPYLGLGIGAALTPPPFSTGLVVEAVGGTRIAPLDVVQFFIQARYILRWSGAGWNAGPVFESGLLVEF